MSQRCPNANDRRSRHGELTSAVEERAALVGASKLGRRIELPDALGDLAALPRMQRQAIASPPSAGRATTGRRQAGITPGAVRGLLHRARTTRRSGAAAVIP
ncbi:MAG TPA: hypothetical protein VL988_12470 [Solirubrobacteraceae bacterium]|nr:hypothetical protein [Solirubrobacteraceae bacterium]